MGVPYTHNEYEHLKQFLHINTKEITLALYKIEGVFSDEDLFILMKICKKHGLEHELQGIIINSHLITTYQLLSEQILLHFIDQIRAEFYSYCNKKVTIIYSISVPLVTIHKTYHDILEALQYINAHTTGQVIELNQMYGILKEKKQEKKLLKTLFYSIACGDKQQVNQNIENLFKTIHHQKTTCTIYRNYLVETLRWIWEEGNFGEKHEISLQSYIEQFSRLTSINDLEKLFYQIVIELTLHIYNSTKLYNNKLVNLLCLYTITYISNEKLTLKWLAKNYLHVDADYLSKLFIKETGQRYKQYLLHLRIEKAKQLLDLYDEDTIYEIATKVGMGNNPQYFSHIFKKHTGLSPSDYKQRHKNRIFNQR
jgi:two-component system response regulator YesN